MTNSCRAFSYTYLDSSRQKDNKKLDSTIADIAENPKNLKFNVLAPEQLAPRLEEVAGSSFQWRISSFVVLSQSFYPTKIRKIM